MNLLTKSLFACLLLIISLSFISINSFFNGGDLEVEFYSSSSTVGLYDIEYKIYSITNGYHLLDEIVDIKIEDNNQVNKYDSKLELDVTNYIDYDEVDYFLNSDLDIEVNIIYYDLASVYIGDYTNNQSFSTNTIITNGVIVVQNDTSVNWWAVWLTIGIIIFISFSIQIIYYQKQIKQKNNQISFEPKSFNNLTPLSKETYKLNVGNYIY